MATIILAIIIAIVTFITLTRNNANKELVRLTVKLIVVAGVVIGLFAPLSGYEGRITLEEIEPIQYENGKFFKTVSSEIYYQYEYRPKVARAGFETMIVENTIRRSRAEVIKTDDKEARIIVYREKARNSIWTFGLCYRERYLIYDPI